MQATVQAALALSPRDAVNAAYSPSSEQGIRYGGYATEALTIAVFEILIAGTLGTLLIRFFAPKLLDKVKHRLHIHSTPQCMLLFRVLRSTACHISYRLWMAALLAKEQGRRVLTGCMSFTGLCLLSSAVCSGWWFVMPAPAVMLQPFARPQQAQKSFCWR